MVSMLVSRFGLQRFLRADEKTQSTRGFSGAIFRGSTFHLSLENAAKSPRFFPGVPTAEDVGNKCSFHHDCTRLCSVTRAGHRCALHAERLSLD